MSLFVSGYVAHMINEIDKCGENRNNENSIS